MMIRWLICTTPISYTASSLKRISGLYLLSDLLCSSLGAPHHHHQRAGGRHQHSSAEQRDVLRAA